MFKRLRERINEVGEEVKRDPRFQNSLASVNKIAHETLSNLNKEKSGSRESLQSNVSQDRVLDLPPNNDHLFSLGDDDETLMNSPGAFPSEKAGFEAVELAHPLSSTPVRTRRGSNSSMTTEAASLFPIYESPQQVYNLPSDLDSTAGSEWEDGSSSAHLSAITKEQLFQMLQKTRMRYHKYKGRYADVAKAYTELQMENDKIKTVMQQTQDKALRRISELREQCQLEQKAKRHLEEELRSDMEEKEHIIEALQTKVTLLKSRESDLEQSEPSLEAEANLIELDGQSVPQGEPTPSTTNNGGLSKDALKIVGLEDKVKRLESLLTKCKESIKANKQKTTALTEVKDNLSQELAQRGEECAKLKTKLEEFETWQKKAQEEEIQIAETKMVMHQEIIAKDEEISKIRSKLKQADGEIDVKTNEVVRLQAEMSSLKESKEALEKSANQEKSEVLEKLIKEKSDAVQKREMELEEKLQESLKVQAERHESKMQAKVDTLEKERERQLTVKEEEMRKSLAEAAEGLKLEKEELELRLSALQSNDGDKSQLLKALESKLISANRDKKKAETQLKELSESLSTLQQVHADHEKDEDSLKSEIRSKNDELAKLRGENQQLAVQMESCSKDSDGKVNGLHEEMAALRKTLEERNEQVAKAKEETEKLVEKIKDHSQELELKNDELSELATLKSALESKEEQMKLLQREHDTAALELEAKSDEIAKILAEKETLTQELKAASAHLEDRDTVQAQMITLRSDLEKETTAKSALQDELTATSEELKSLVHTADELRKEIEAMASTMSQIRSEKDSLENTVASKEEAIQKLSDDHKTRLQELEDQFCATKSGEVSEASTRYANQLSLVQEQHAIEIKELKDNLEAIEKMLQSKEATLTETEGALDTLKKSSVTQITTYANLKDEFDTLEAKLESTNGQISNLESQLSGHTSTKEELERIKETHQTLVESEVRLESDHVELLSKWKKAVEEKEQIGFELEERVKNANETKERLQAEHMDLKTKFEEIQSINKAQEHAQTRLDETESRNAELNNQVQTLERQVQLSGEDRLNAEQSLRDQTKELGKTCEELKTLQSEHLSIQGKIASKCDTIVDLEKELASLKDRVVSHESLKDQMIHYEKELQERVRSMEDEAKNLNESMHAMREQLASKEEHIQKMSESHLAETEKIKSDLEMKVRLERERDNSSKDHMVQSIEYQKRLQEQLEEKETILRETTEKLQKNTQSHLKEVERLSTRIEELTKNITDLEAERDALEQGKAQQETSLQGALEAKTWELEQLKAVTESEGKAMQELVKVEQEKWQEIEAAKIKIEDDHQLQIKQNESLQSELTSVSALKEDLLTRHQTLENELASVLVSKDQLQKDAGDQSQRIRELESEIESLKQAITKSSERSRDLEERLQSQDPEDRIKALVKEFEKKLAVGDRDHEDELQKLRDEAEQELSQSLLDAREQVNALNHELYEKTTLYDELVDKHAHELSVKQQELEEELEACSRMYQVKIAEYEATQEAKMLELEQKVRDQEKSQTWNHWDHDDVEDLQKETAAPAMLSVNTLSSNVSRYPHYNGGHTLEEATEFEYLRNILYQYMLGKESLTLAKVLATVVKFTADQRKQVIAHEEKKHSVLSGLGLS